LFGIKTVEECHAQCFRSKESDTPDLVLNLPISINKHQSSSISHSTIIIDLIHTSPETIMKKSEKNLQLIKHQPISICGSSKATEV
jgi:hypothetical protein